MFLTKTAKCQSADFPQSLIPAVFTSSGKFSFTCKAFIRLISLCREIRGFLQKQLPEYMVPVVFMSLHALPITPNGKLDRQALPSPDDICTHACKSTDSPRNAIETKLDTIWSEVLGPKSIGIHDNFFELGGHSLLATLVISRIRAALKVQIPLRSLFETPTIAGLAETVALLQSGSDTDDEVARILAELEDVSDEEAERILSQIETDSAAASTEDDL